MTEVREFFGETMEEAIGEAEKVLQMSRENMEIEEVKEKKGLFTKKSRQSAVAVRPKTLSMPDGSSGEVTIDELLQQAEELNSVPVPGEQEDDFLKGKAWVHNGKIYCRDDEDAYPIVTTATGVRLLRNGSELNDRSVITEEDELTVELQNEQKDTSWNLSISSDKQRVELSVEPGAFIIRKLKDTPPSEFLVLEADEYKQSNNQLSEKDIYDKLEECNVSYGLKEEEIQKACEVTYPAVFLIAEGKPPEHGKDGEVKYHIDTSAKRMPATIGEDDIADYRASNYIPTIDEGEVLADITFPLPGKEGVDVHGESQEARDGRPMVVRTGAGITYFENERKVIALQSGRPKVEEKGKMVRISIMPKLVHERNVDLKSGNLYFIGDIDIHGNIEETMKAEAGGELTVNGYLMKATAVSGHSVFIRKNVVNSRIVAGNYHLILANIGNQIQQLNKQMKELVNAVSQLRNMPSFQQSDYGSMDFKSLLTLLLERKFTTFVSEIKELEELLEKDKDFLDAEWQNIAKKLHHSFIIFHKNGVKNEKELKELYNQMLFLEEVSTTPSFPDAEVSFSGAMNSTIYSCGDVHVFGKGCSHTTLHAAGKITVVRSFVGGKLYGGKGVELNTAGSKSGAKTEVEVPEGQAIKIKKAMEDTVLKIGNKKHVCKEAMNNITARVNEDGEWVFHES